jgi:hypothetical protein
MLLIATRGEAINSEGEDRDCKFCVAEDFKGQLSQTPQH